MGVKHVKLKLLPSLSSLTPCRIGRLGRPIMCIERMVIYYCMRDVCHLCQYLNNLM